MNFFQLSKKRKDVVEILIEKFPEIKETGTVTFKQIRSVWVNEKAYVDPNKQQKYGYPLWITIEKDFKSGTRGVYLVPLPTINDYVMSNNQPKQKQQVLTTKQKSDKVSLISDDEFMAELAEAGISI